MNLRPGQKLHSAVSDVQVVVIRAPATDVDVRCGGVPLLDDAPAPDATGEIVGSPGDGPLLGKRYADEDAGLELLCSRGGEGALTVGGRPLLVKGAKPLPSSD